MLIKLHVFNVQEDIIVVLLVFGKEIFVWIIYVIIIILIFIMEDFVGRIYIIVVSYIGVYNGNVWVGYVCYYN